MDDALHLAARPRLRGRLHLAAAGLSVLGLVWLVSEASGGVALVAAWIYGLAGIALYLTSGTYHVFTHSPRARRIMRRADHSMIYLLIAGSATPATLLLLDGWARIGVFVAIWAGAATGVLLKVVAFDRFPKLGASLYIILGWAALLLVPAFLDRPRDLALMATAGVLYTVGAALFAARWPRLSPRWFGYHEVWHTLGVAAGALLFALNLGLVRTAGV